MAQIMIVEDNQGTNKAICEYLKTAGHTLFPALDGEEALNIFRDNSIDLAVLDIMLPKMSGVTILHEIRKISNIPVVMLTAVDDEYTQSNSFDELADDYISSTPLMPFAELSYTMQQSTHGVTGINGGKGKYPLNISQKKSFIHFVRQTHIS